MLILILIAIIIVLVFLYIHSKNELKKIDALKSAPVNTEVVMDVPQLDTDNSAFVAMLEKRQKLMEAYPNYNEQFGRPDPYPRYDDSFDTDTGYSLRELLILVWWAQVKKGRLVTTKIPKYFAYDYNLNGQRITQDYIDKGWLIKQDDRYILSSEAKLIADKYKDLWQMNQSRNFPINLDVDFPNWNHGKLLKFFYNCHIQYLNKCIEYYTNLNKFYNQYPDFFADSDTLRRELDVNDKQITSAKNDIDYDKVRIEAIDEQ